MHTFLSQENNVTENTGAAFSSIPRLAMVNSMAGFGRCSTTISLPVISAMQVQVCPIPTSILSNHLGFPTCYHNDYTPHMRNYIHAWKELGATFDGLYCGFLGSIEQINIVEEFLDIFHPPLFLLDPVMGDNGKAYSTITPQHCTALKKLLARADILTPNITEACLLTDTPYKEGPWMDYELHELCRKLTALCPGRIIITGLRNTSAFLNYIWEDGQYSTYVTPLAGGSYHGAGDLFASIIVANLLHNKKLVPSVKMASDYVALCIQEAEKMGLPEKEGIPFEKHLYSLIKATQ